MTTPKYKPREDDQTRIYTDKWIPSEELIRTTNYWLHHNRFQTAREWHFVWNDMVPYGQSFSEAAAKNPKGSDGPFKTAPKGSNYYGVLYPASFTSAENSTNPAAKTWSTLIFDPADHSGKIATAKATDLAMTLMQFSANGSPDSKTFPLVEMQTKTVNCTTAITEEGTPYHRLEWNDLDYDSNGRWTTVAGYILKSEMATTDSIKSLSTKTRTNKANIEANYNNIHLIRTDTDNLSARVTKEYDDMKTIANKNKQEIFHSLGQVTDNLNELKRKVEEESDDSELTQKLQRLQSEHDSLKTIVTAQGQATTTTADRIVQLQAGHDDHDAKLRAMNLRVNKLERNTSGASIWDVIGTAASVAANSAVLARNAKAIAEDTKDTTLRDIKDVSNTIKTRRQRWKT